MYNLRHIVIWGLMKNFTVLWLIMVISFLLNAAEPISPIPQSLTHDTPKAAIGKRLFFDPILSHDKTIACVSCHSFEHGGSDPRPVSIGVKGNEGCMQAPTVLNAVFNFTQFWNGRAKNLQEQAAGPIHNPLEMGMTTEEVEQRINADERYRKAFTAITKRSTVLFTDISEAIAEYEKTLITPNGKFDRFLRKETMLEPEQMEGYELFKRLGCASCHNGVNVGGNSFQKFGVVAEIERLRKMDDRFVLTGRESDKNVFKVPTLRNIALTAPYFHDASASTLKEAITVMSHHNLGITLSADEVSHIVAFLHTLTGELPLSAITP